MAAPATGLVALRTRTGNASVDRVIAHDALNWPEARRLMTVPGVNMIVAATFLAAVGNIERFRDRRKLVAYLGLDPKVRRSGDAPANHGLRVRPALADRRQTAPAGDHCGRAAPARPPWRLDR